MDRLVLTMQDGVADVRLDRPEKLNALDPAMFAALAALPAHLAGIPDVRAVVLSGAGRAFCAGLDLSAIRADPASADRLLGDRDSHGANLVQQAALSWRRLSAPVICALHGAVFGGGLQIALGCDLRISAPDAQLSFMEIKWGLVPDMAATVLLRGLVRDDVARELIWTGRIVRGADAALLGLVSRVSNDPQADAMNLAREIAAKPSVAIQASKRLLNLAADASAREILLAETDVQSQLLPQATITRS